MDLYKSDSRNVINKINTSLKKGKSEELNNIKNYSNIYDIWSLNKFNLGNSTKLNTKSSSYLNLNSSFNKKKKNSSFNLINKNK
jgi:hypothetical protein